MNTWPIVQRHATVRALHHGGWQAVACYADAHLLGDVSLGHGRIDILGLHARIHAEEVKGSLVGLWCHGVPIPVALHHVRAHKKL